MDTWPVLSLSFSRIMEYPIRISDFLYRIDPLRFTGRVLQRMEKDMTRVLVESTVRRTLKSIQESPERATRNLIDLGLEFSNGRFQTRLFRQAQKMLQNQKSAYYDLVKNMVATVDHDIIATFGVNLGYNSCTKGAQRIREIEAEKGFNIPWALNLAVNEEKLEKKPELYPSIIRQGTALGIHTYLLFITGCPEKVLPMIEKEPDCAFVLFLHGAQISSTFLKEMETVKNVLVSVYTDADMPDVCQKLRDAKRLYAVHQRYMEQDKENILNGEWLKSILPAGPAFAFLRADFSCTPRTQEDIYRYVTTIRDEQRVPLIFMDIKQDTLLIDQVISDGECLAGFDVDGSLRTHEGFWRDEPYNIFRHPLEDILQGASKKESEPKG